MYSRRGLIIEKYPLRRKLVNAALFALALTIAILCKGTGQLPSPMVQYLPARTRHAVYDAGSSLAPAIEFGGQSFVHL